MQNGVERIVKLDQLLLDPNNYRFQDDPTFQFAQATRFHEAMVQRKTFERIRGEGINDLKASIRHNGFLTFERIIVRPYGRGDLFVVIEGNRRVAALRSLKEDHEAGIEVPQGVVTVFQELPVSCVESDDSALHLSLMGIRHVSGVRQWGSYQSSKLVSELHDEHDLEFSEIGARLGMSTREVTRRFRAFKALRQMEEDEEFSEYCERRMYPMFHEAVSQPMIRQWLQWDESSSEFKDETNLRHFYELIASIQNDEGLETKAKITTANEVRELKTIIGSPEARLVLTDPNRSFAEALAVAKTEELQHAWTTQVAEANKALAGIPALELRRLEPEHLAVLETLSQTLQDVLDTYRRLALS
ncbi:ParB N-terminal domain-containing protein [Streptomyces sp. NPDC091281]|uniref:ParB N-terminal domain-containing protein n=1 Tax=Streptomyces sp. NPDC091281 TaxID=3365985 RepID=UPI0038175FC1